ncbi:adventurous gliding motility lipoprotein CglB [Archangium violaceum]|uniref:adventurous gliding motility lipoprotein CglB n=1 Tax=Archangium violaceum TaxID=83451 RepID=UPI00194F0CF2|nr:adventurous gliding motility lipoprotein CglB [Archangium violaceum]QRN98463.1 adventurous gliding motility lipoprotein CglB [Archangium violaceum]
MNPGIAGLETGTSPSDGGTSPSDAGTTVLAQVEVRNLKPDLMLLVDTSGSMTEPVEPSSSSCIVNGQTCGPNTWPCDTYRCPTRWSSLQAAMASFLSEYGAMARLGLGTYPENASCGSTTHLRVGLPTSDDETTLKNKAFDVIAAIQGIPNSGSNMPSGGTPTGQSLRFMSSLPDLLTAERADFVLLLTDGVPNCNEAYPYPYPSPQCQCTLNPEYACTYVPSVGCLDQDGSIAAIQELRDRDIRTIVVGFGAETGSSTGQSVLNAMAEAGGFARQCQQSSDCGTGDTCDTATGFCGRRFYQTGNRAELVAALRAVSEKLSKESCLVRFEVSAGTPPQESLQVSLDGTVVAPGPDSWSLTKEGVLFTGSACQRIQAATSTAPMHIEVRALL